MNESLKSNHPVPIEKLHQVEDFDCGIVELNLYLQKDALARTMQAAEIAGLRAVLVHAKDDDAKAFYKRYDFVSSPIHENHLYLLLKDLKNLFK